VACIFCEIASGARAAHVVHEDASFIAFLDHRPLFPGHVLVVPRVHHETLLDLPGELAGPLLLLVQRIARAVETGLLADGFFVAMNNRISQSVPHLHAHVIPRRKKDGLKGFFWPRNAYKNEEEIALTLAAIRKALEG
jgi:histidine triad (HIT) family protein